MPVAGNPLSQGDARATAHEYMPSFLAQRKELLKLEPWIRGEQDETAFIPPEHEIKPEYRDLATRSQTPWARLIVRTLNQTMFYEGIRRPKFEGNMKVWDTWRQNGWIARQTALHYEAIGLGLAFGVALPAIHPMTGKKTVLCEAYSGLDMMAVYQNTSDEYPMAAMHCQEAKVPGRYGLVNGWTVTLYDEVATYYLYCHGQGQGLKQWFYISHERHGSPGITPVQRFAPYLDLQNNARSEIRPLLPLLMRIDQDAFDRLIVQKWGAWKVRYITGLVRPNGMTEEDAKKQLVKFNIDSFLALESKDSKIGTLDATDLIGFIKAHEADLRDLSAVSQTPPHQMLGLSTNVGAEALAAVEAGLQRKGMETKNSLQESHLSFGRLCSYIEGNQSEAQEFNAELRWRDMESRSFAQIADSLQKLRIGTELPLEMLWEYLPNWSDDKTERAKMLMESGVVESLVSELARQDAAANPPDNASE
ncbi:MAG: phage portal protein [Gemmatimonadota bacterium]|nr:phage portal protein [Gemmatimonadota bacterium]